MSHYISMTDKLACTGNHPWHFNTTGADGRTVMCGDEPQSGETLRKVALPWEPVKLPLFYKSEDGTVDRPADAFAIVRDDGLGCLTKGRAVSESYTPFLNRRFVNVGDLLVASGEAKWHTLGSLMGGRHVFGSLQAAGDVKVVGPSGIVDTLAPFLMLFSAHDGTHSLEAMFTT
ncbi:MAG: DUF932 domain-containing protein, partial [Nevskiales bacterium]